MLVVNFFVFATYLCFGCAFIIHIIERAIDLRLFEILK